MKNSDSQPEPQNPCLKPLGPVYKVCVQDTLSNVSEMAVINSCHSAKGIIALRVVLSFILPRHTVQLICSPCWHSVWYLQWLHCFSTLLCIVLACLKVQCSKKFKLHKLFKNCVAYQHLNTVLAASFSVIRTWTISRKRHGVMSKVREEWLYTST